VLLLVCGIAIKYRDNIRQAVERGNGRPSGFVALSSGNTNSAIHIEETVLMDPLSDFLPAMRVQSAVYTRVEATEPWAMGFNAYHHTKFGIILQGECLISVEGDTQAIALSAGSCYLLPRGNPRSVCYRIIDSPLSCKNSDRVINCDTDNRGRGNCCECNVFYQNKPGPGFSSCSIHNDKTLPIELATISLKSGFKSHDRAIPKLAIH
jgi:hypothetical protein